MMTTTKIILCCTQQIITQVYHAMKVKEISTCSVYYILGRKVPIPGIHSMAGNYCGQDNRRGIY